MDIVLHYDINSFSLTIYIIYLYYTASVMIMIYNTHAITEMI